MSNCQYLEFAQSQLLIAKDGSARLQHIPPNTLDKVSIADFKPYLIEVTKLTFNYGDEVTENKFYGVYAPSLEHAKAWIYNNLFAYDIDVQSIQDVYDWVDENMDEEMGDFVDVGDIWYRIDNIREIPLDDFKVIEKYNLFNFKNFWAALI